MSVVSSNLLTSVTTANYISSMLFKWHTKTDLQMERTSAFHSHSSVTVPVYVFDNRIGI